MRARTEVALGFACGGTVGSCETQGGHGGFVYPESPSMTKGWKGTKVNARPERAGEIQ